VFSVRKSGGGVQNFKRWRGKAGEPTRRLTVTNQRWKEVVYMLFRREREVWESLARLGSQSVGWRW
jgi:hypothetical protein